MKEIEEGRRNHLFALAQAYDQAKSIRNLVLALAKSGNKEANFDQWLDWAEKIANQIDPIEKQAEILSRYHQIEAKEP